MLRVIRSYSLPLLLAAVVHALAAAALYGNWHPPKRETRELAPRVIQSQLILLQPQAKPQPKPPAAPKPAPAPKPPEPRPEPPAAAKPAAQPQPPAAPDLQAEQQRRAQESRQRRLQDLAQQAFAQALESEALELAQGEEDEAAASFRYGIYRQVVANWSRPPSARNGMQARLLVELIPTGEVIAVSLLESSGSAAFDRSAEAAVRKARDFEVPEEPRLFERYFRRFSLLFRPEDLLR